MDVEGVLMIGFVDMVDVVVVGFGIVGFGVVYVVVCCGLCVIVVDCMDVLVGVMICNFGYLCIGV